MRPAENDTKRNVVENLLAEGGRLLLMLDARALGCMVPEHLADNHALALAIGYNLTPPIPDLLIDPGGISGTLTFGGVPRRCVIPWDALYVAHLEGCPERGVFWPASFPAERARDLAAAPQLTAAEEKARKRAHLKLVN